MFHSLFVFFKMCQFAVVNTGRANAFIETVIVTEYERRIFRNQKPIRYVFGAMELAPKITREPMVTPGRIIELTPMKTSSPILIGAYF